MKVLTKEAEDERAEFEAQFGDRGCTCFISPPCAFCTHPGNPLNQNEDDTAWEDVQLVCVDNTGIENRFDVGEKYEVEESQESSLVYAKDKNGEVVTCFRFMFMFL